MADRARIGGMTSSTYVSSGGAELAVSVWGNGGHTLVALHPGVGDRRIWNWCAPRWVEAGYRVVAYDRRGFGDTRYEAEPHDDLADLTAVLDRTGATPAVVIGNSRGGGLALDHALDSPTRVTALVLVAPSPSGYDASRWLTSPAEEEEDHKIEEAEAADDLELVNRLEVRYWLDGVDQPEGRVTGEARTLLTDMNRRALRAHPIGDPAPHPPNWDRLPDVSIPTLIVVGRHDLPGVVRQAEETAERMPNARLEVLDESAHCPSLDQPDVLSSLVVEFLAGVAGGASVSGGPEQLSRHLPSE